MVGFALIIIIVAVLLMIFFSVSMKKTNEDLTESYEPQKFIQAILSYTTDCEVDYSNNYHNLRRLIFDCKDKKPCLDERDSCDVLNQTLKGLLESSWTVGIENPNKGYLLNMTVEGEEVLSFEGGNKTNINQGTSQILPEGLEIRFIVYN